MSDSENDRTVIVSTPQESGLQQGLFLGVYRIDKKLGEGGMGAVYKATHRKLKRTVALKILPQHRLHEDEVARFEREMAATGQLSHRNIVVAHDAGEADGHHYLAMELVKGVDLNELSSACGPLEIGSACELVRQAAIGLHHAHKHGMVHRDIKPSNLMLSTEGVVKILDLGLAKLQNDIEQKDLTGTGQLMGTIAYMASEQGNDSHSVDIRADIYSLGATLHKLLTGEVPYSGPGMTTQMEKLMALATVDPPAIKTRRPGIPYELAAIVDKMLKRSADERFSEPRQIVHALKPFAESKRLKLLLKQTLAATPKNKEAATVPSCDAGAQTSSGKRNDVTALPTIQLSEDPLPRHRRTRGGKRGRKQTARKKGGTTKWKMPVLASATILAAIALAVFAFSQKVTVETKAGKIVVETLGKETEISIKGETVSFEDPSDNELVTVSVDYQQNQLTFTKDGFTAITRKVDLTSKAGDKVSIRFEPNATGADGFAMAAVPDAGLDSAKQLPNSPPTESQRAQKEILNWAFKNGLHQVTGLAGGKAFTMRQATEFPADRIESFRSIDLNPEKMSTGVLARLNSIADVERLTFSLSMTCPENAIHQIGQLPALKDLGIYCSHFSTKPFEGLPASICHRLVAFNVPNLRMRDSDVARIVRLFPNLKEVGLRGSHMTALAGTYLKELPLTEISFRECNIETQSSFGELTLVTLATFDRQELHDFSHLPPNLETLICTDAKIQRMNFDQLIEYESLKNISLRSSSVGEADEAAFRTARPDCKLGISRRAAATANEPASMTNLQLLEWAFQNGLQKVNVVANGRTFYEQTTATQFRDQRIDSIDWIIVDEASHEVIARLQAINGTTCVRVAGVNPLSSAMIEQLAKLPLLNHLTLDCPVPENQVPILAKATDARLVYVGLFNETGSVTDAIVNSIAKHFPKLNRVGLYAAELTSASTQSLKSNSPSLKSLILVTPNLELQRSLDQLTTLNDLKIDLAPVDLSNLPPHLQFFNCDCVTLTPENYDQLIACKTLKGVRSRCTQVDKAAVAAFRTARPDCQFVSEDE